MVDDETIKNGCFTVYLVLFLRKYYVDLLKKQTGYPLFNDIELIHKNVTEAEEREYELSAGRNYFM